MRVKIFQAWGHPQIEKLEGQINAWLKDRLPFDMSVKRTETALAGTRDDDGSENITQALVVTIWYGY